MTFEFIGSAHIDESLAKSAATPTADREHPGAQVGSHLAWSCGVTGERQASNVATPRDECKVADTEGGACTSALRDLLPMEVTGLRIRFESRTRGPGELRLWRASERPTVMRSVHQTVNEVREPKALTNASRSGRWSHQDETKVDRTGGQSLCLWGRSK